MEETETGPRRLHIASWSSRFWAWLIDVVLVGAVANAFWSAVGLFAFLSLDPPAAGRLGEFGGLNGVGLWIYWTLFEGYRGQSIGKMVLDLRVTDRKGESIGYGAAAIEALGKAFLLPIDLLVGVLAYEGRKLRLFNRLSQTIVVETEADAVEAPEGVEYVFPDEE